jgi:MFS family permease
MEQASKKLWNRDFSLLIAGQIMSIFGNMILSWALPFYVLDISGSAALFGLVIGLPYISLLVMSPIGGIMADRLRKQRIMFWLDLTTTVIIVLYMVASGLFTAVVPLVIVKLLALNAIQGMYMPAVQSAVPALVPTEKLVPANAAVTVINSLSNILAPAAAGILYSGFGLFPILAISAVCFAITAIMDLFIRIPYKKQNRPGSITQMIKNDMLQAFEFAVKEQPVLAKCAVLIFLFTITLVSLLLVGLPVLITQNLDMSMDMVGISSSIMMVGGLLGGITAGVLGRRLTIRKVHIPFILCCISIIPMGLIFLFEVPVFIIYAVITGAGTLTLMGMQLGSIQIMAFIQEKTPGELIGKVLSILVILPFLANALGQLLYGVLFEHFGNFSWVIIIVTAFVSVVIAILFRSHFKNVTMSNIGECNYENIKEVV